MRDDERELYRLHARLPVYRRHVDTAKLIVRRALAEHPGVWAVAMSGGKDSTALLSVALEAGWRGPVFHFWAQETPPENTAAVVHQAEANHLQVISGRVRGDFDTWERLGHAFVLPTTPEERAVYRAANRHYKSDANAMARQAGLTGLFIGMRADESRARRIVVARHGVIYQAKSQNGLVTALPLAKWTARDVWSRIVAADLQWLQTYDLGFDRERERSETTWLGFDEIWHRGQGRRLRETNPELWFRITNRWPELAQYG